MFDFFFRKTSSSLSLHKINFHTQLIMAKTAQARENASWKCTLSHDKSQWYFPLEYNPPPPKLLVLDQLFHHQTLMITAIKRCPGPWPWGSVQVYLITHPTSQRLWKRTSAVLLELTLFSHKKKKEHTVSARGETMRSTGHRITGALLHAAPFSQTTNKNENNYMQWCYTWIILKCHCFFFCRTLLY